MPTKNQQPSLKTLFRTGVFVITAAAIGYLLYQSADQLAEKQFTLSTTAIFWWLAAILVYGCSMLLSSFYWHYVLVAFGQRPNLLNSVTAFFASQLGKYVPGKAMVVVIRTDMIRGATVNTKPAAASVFVETLTWIFTGAVIASLLIVVRFREHQLLQLAAAAIAIASGVLTWPSIFQKIAARVSSLGTGKRRNVFAGLNLKTSAIGWLILTLGWLLNAASLWMVMHSITGQPILFHDYWLALACVSLATVAGFVSLLPGGVGVRELVMIPLLSPSIGSANAIIIAIIIRLVWLATELIGAGACFISQKFGSRKIA